MNSPSLKHRMRSEQDDPSVFDARSVTDPRTIVPASAFEKESLCTSTSSHLIARKIDQANSLPLGDAVTVTSISPRVFGPLSAYYSSFTSRSRGTLYDRTTFRVPTWVTWHNET
jgi:hypothetical protein